MDPDTYAPFLFHPDTGMEITPHEFCERYVEAFGKEAGELNRSFLFLFRKLFIYFHIPFRSRTDYRPVAGLKNQCQRSIP